MAFPKDDHAQISGAVEELKGGTDLAVGETVKGQVDIFGNGVRMIDAIDPLGHEDGLLLEGHGLRVVAHDVIQPGQHAEALCNLRVHRTVNIVQEVQGLTNKFITIF